MKKLYGAELARIIKEERQRYVAALERRDKRIADGITDEDDCFMSIRVEEQGIRKCDMELSILDTDGTMEIDAIFDTDGNEVFVHSFCNKWRRTTYVARGIFANSISALLKKTGWTQRKINVPCWVRFEGGSGGGMCAVYTGSYRIVRWHTNMLTGEYVGFPN